MRCRYCNAELAAGAIFCQRCGKPVENDEFSSYGYDTGEQSFSVPPIPPAASDSPNATPPQPTPSTPALQPSAADQQQPAQPVQPTQPGQPSQQEPPAQQMYPGQPIGPTMQPYVPQQAYYNPQYYQGAGPFPQAFQPTPGMFPPVVPPKRTGLSPTVVILLVVLALLVGGGGVFAFFSLSHRSPPSSQTPGTSTPTRTNATGTTGDPLQLYTRATSGSPTLVDPLDATNPNGWQAISSGGACTFAGKTLQLSAKAAGSGKSAIGVCLALATDFSDFAYQVNTTISQGDIAGLTFRTDPFAGVVYQFGIDDTGGYILYTLVTNSAGKTALKILTEGSNPAIKAGANQSNVLTVIAQGSSINLYANQQYLASVTDSTASGGEIGLFGENTNGGAVNITYSSIKVWQL
ncbi:MAG TPA: zinc ribbon domain-containing protein [Ktedonobacteraceae bacterium]|nr:zinc ribbon domain-containing protein [Ktedonobacteraceae bacterium]